MSLTDIMPLTAFMTLLGGLVMLGSWALISHRMSTSKKGVSVQVKLLNSFFLYMGIFSLIIFLPHLLLNVDPSQFPPAMAWGYVVGHIFAYAAFICVVRLTFSMVPRLASKEKFGIIAGIVASIVITVLNLFTMVYGTQPMYDTDRGVTFFNAAPVVGFMIVVFAAASVFPAAILMIINGVKNPSTRLRSFLLGGGLLVLMTAGPLHDTARTWQLYTVADVVSIFGFVLIASGVLYRFEERIAIAKQPAVPVASS